MRLATKVQISRSSLTLLTLTTWLFLLGLVGVVICAGFEINPFRETTTSVLISGFAGLVGLASILVLLNVASNLSLIAESKITTLEFNEREGGLNRWALAFGVATVLVVTLIIGGTYLSKRRYIAAVQSQAEEVLQKNQDTVQRLGALLPSTKPEDIEQIGKLQSFLQGQRDDFPSITIVYSGRYEGKLVFYRFPDYLPDRLVNKFEPVYFKCKKNVDCDYLTHFFSGERADVLKKYSMRDDQFSIYMPFITQQSRYVLLFERRNTYGKIGS